MTEELYIPASSPIQRLWRDIRVIVLVGAGFYAGHYHGLAGSNQIDTPYVSQISYTPQTPIRSALPQISSLSNRVKGLIETDKGE